MEEGVQPFTEWERDFLARIKADRSLRLDDFDARLAAVVPPATPDRATVVEHLRGVVLEACHGAVAFAGVHDLRSTLRARHQLYKERAPKMRQAAKSLRDFFEEHFEHRVQINSMVLGELGSREYVVRAYDSNWFLLDVLDLIGRSLDEKWFLDLTHHEQLSSDGCINRGRGIDSPKKRGTRQMLAFNLEWQMRVHSMGNTAIGDQMPSSDTSVPHQAFVADLIDAMAPAIEQAEHARAGRGAGEPRRTRKTEPTPVTAAWVQTTVRGLLRDYPDARLVPWPKATDPWPFSNFKFS